MSKLPNTVVGEARTSDFAQTVLTNLTDIGNRMAGQDGERRGAELVTSAFDDAGLRNPHLEEFAIPGWWRGDSRIELSGAVDRTHTRSHEVIALPGSPSGHVEGPLVDVGTGTYREFSEHANRLRGSIVVASSRTPDRYDRWLHRMEKYAQAAEAGAAGFVFRNHVDGALPPTGEIGYHNRPGPIPAIGVSKEVGSRLTRCAETGVPTARVDVDCRTKETTSVNAVAEVGPKTETAVYVTAHVDAHDISDGANDNGAGSALVAEVGRLLSLVENELDTRVRLITFGAEEVGLWGAYHAAETAIDGSIKCVINLDGACNSRDLSLGYNGFDEMKRIFESVAKAYDTAISTRNAISPHGDQWAFVQEGIPSVMASTQSSGSGRGWGHTHADTLDKLDSRDLCEIATLIADATLRFADDDVEISSRSPDEIRDAIDDGYKQELKTGGRWPFE